MLPWTSLWISTSSFLVLVRTWYTVIKPQYLQLAANSQSIFRTTVSMRNIRACSLMCGFHCPRGRCLES